jgi:CPA1 family monovalent cation:H+ antiporter
MADQLMVNFGLILLVASVVAMASRRMRLLYSVGLVAAGIVLAILPFGIGIPVSADGIYTILLPPLIFETALQIDWPPFRRELPIVLTLAFAGVIIAATVVAVGMHGFFNWGWLSAAMFGCLIAATDPVSVIASFKEMRVEPRLSLLVEAESLLNDGTAAVGFTVLIVLASGSMVDPASVGALLLWKVLGGVLVGGGLAGGVLLLAGRTEDHLVEITLTTIIAYGSFLIAERLGASGVLASLAAGMVVGNIGKRGYISRNGRAHMLSFWEYAAFLANSIVFILIGLHEAHQALGFLTRMAAIAIALVLLGRAASVYLLCTAFSMSRLAVSQSYQHILVWGGLRGALALALAMTLPDNLAERSEMVVAAFEVVAFSIFVQGLTMPLLIGWLGLMRPAVPKVK